MTGDVADVMALAAALRSGGDLSAAQRGYLADLLFSVRVAGRLAGLYAELPERRRDAPRSGVLSVVLRTYARCPHSGEAGSGAPRPAQGPGSAVPAEAREAA